MKRDTMDDPDQTPVNKGKAIGVEVQFPGKQEQVCAVGNNDRDCSRQQDAFADRHESSNKRFVNDREQLLRILPEELWLLVFEKLDSSDDLERASNSSPYFRELLLPERVNFLFKDVWKILGWQYSNYFGNDDDDSVDDTNDDSDEADVEDTDPENGLRDVSSTSSSTTDDDEDSSDVDSESGSSDSTLFSKLPLPFRPDLIFFEPDGAIEEALTLRLVCRSWSKVIDEVYQKRNLKLNSSKYVTSLLSHFEATHGSVANTRSPFLGRKVTIYVGTFNDYHWKFLDGIRTILFKYGQNFLHCRFTVCTALPYHSRAYCGRFMRMLQKMPKLKRLEIIGPGVPGVVLPGNYWPLILSEDEEMEDLEAEISVNPWLPLGVLQELIVDGLPLPIFRVLIRINGQVTNSTTELEGHDVLNLPFVSNLKSLSVLRCPKQHFQLLTSAQIDWYLTKLELDFSCKSDFTEWQSVFTALENKFRNTLTYLHINLPEITRKKDREQVKEKSKCYKLYLPHLTELALAVPVGYVPCLDFLLLMKESLRVLILSVEGKVNLSGLVQCVERGDGGVLKIWSCLQCPLESNIWTRFPKLEKFEFRDNTGGTHIRRDYVDFSFVHNRREWKMKMKNAKRSTLPY